ncbi:MAG: 4-hydroxy-2-oxovalerate aldolase [Candidatus Omnitrophica bacterium]|nr:4-hydroxy-2-oxovalerate aldolase [Candidatus Omnitrophota bacterium]
MRSKTLSFNEGPLFGAWTQFGHPSITEIFAASGFDFIGIDMEHSTIALGEAQRIIAAAHAGGAACLPRISSHNGVQASRLLDSGADGIIVPNVQTLDQVREAVSWIKYPPQGMRGFGVARAQGYGFDFDQYVSTWNARAVLVVQIESMRGVEQAEAIVSHESVQGAMIGPYDISGSLGIPGKLSHPRVREACRRVIEACRRCGKACGTQVVDPTDENVREALAEGYRFVILGADVFLLWKWGERMHAIVKTHRDEYKAQAPAKVMRLK